MKQKRITYPIIFLLVLLMITLVIMTIINVTNLKLDLKSKTKAKQPMKKCDKEPNKKCNKEPKKDPSEPKKNPNEPKKNPNEPKKNPYEPKKDPNEPKKDPNEPNKDNNEQKLGKTTIATRLMKRLANNKSKQDNEKVRDEEEYKKEEQPIKIKRENSGFVGKFKDKDSTNRIVKQKVKDSLSSDSVNSEKPEIDHLEGTSEKEKISPKDHHLSSISECSSQETNKVDRFDLDSQAITYGATRENIEESDKMFTDSNIDTDSNEVINVDKKYKDEQNGRSGNLCIFGRPSKKKRFRSIRGKNLFIGNLNFINYGTKLEEAKFYVSKLNDKRVIKDGELFEGRFTASSSTN